MILALIIFSTLCMVVNAICIIALVIGQRGAWKTALSGVALYCLPPTIMLWVLFARIP